MRTEGFAQLYESFFSQRGSVPRKLTPQDEPLNMNPLQAIGLVDNLGDLVKKAATMGHRQLREEAQVFYDNSFIMEAFFYHVMAELKDGKSIEDITSREFEGNSAMVHFQVTPMPYTLHQVRAAGIRNNPIVIFLDWDGTMEVNGGLRKHTMEFLNHYATRNQELGVHRYALIITSASFDLMKKVGRYGDELLGLIDGIYSVPGIYRQGTEDKHTVAGKLYTDICKRLRISNDRAIILTDVWADQSVENSYPITTIVTPEDIAADTWIRTIQHFETLGDGDFSKGAHKVRTQPFGFKVDPDLPANARPWRTYKAAGDQFLWRNPTAPNCYCIGEENKLPQNRPK